MSLPVDFLDELKARVGIAEVIGKSVKLARRGRQFIGLCPFHGEKTPSFHVYDDHYHCFGCGAHGSAIDFVMQSEKVGFREAVERLAHEAGLALPPASPQAEERQRRRASLYDVLEAATRYFRKMLRMAEGAAALQYLRARGVGEPAIDRFQLGYAPSGGFATKAALIREGFTDDALIEAGILVRPEDGSRGPYDRFRDRVMYPICDRRGRVVGFGGRILGQGEPKYLNSPETPLFHKGRSLYNLAGGAKAAREKGTLIVVEGYMDVIGLSEAGWDNVVAPLGTALTEEQLQTLWQLTPEPILLFDPDAAGERAAVRAAERALSILKPGLGLKIAILRVDTKDDPDRVAARYSAQLVHRTLLEAAPLSEFLFRLENKGRVYLSPEERAATEERLRRRAITIADPVVRAHFVRAFRDRTWQALRAAKRTKHSAAALPVAVRVGASEANSSSGRAQAEVILVAILLMHPEFFHQVEDAFGQIQFSDRTLDRLRQDIIQALSGNSIRDTQTLREVLAAGGMADAVGEVLDCPLVRSHRLIAPAAALHDLEETWSENIAALRICAREGDQDSAAKRPGAGSFALLARRHSTTSDSVD
jgi:DNA primase